MRCSSYVTKNRRNKNKTQHARMCDRGNLCRLFVANIPLSFLPFSNPRCGSYIGWIVTSGTPEIWFCRTFCVYTDVECPKRSVLRHGTYQESLGTNMYFPFQMSVWCTTNTGLWCESRKFNYLSKNAIWWTFNNLSIQQSDFFCQTAILHWSNDSWPMWKNERKRW